MYLSFKVKLIGNLMTSPKQKGLLMTIWGLSAHVLSNKEKNKSKVILLPWLFWLQVLIS